VSWRRTSLRSPQTASRSSQTQPFVHNPLQRMSKITTFTHLGVCCYFFRSRPIICSCLKIFVTPLGPPGARGSGPLNRLNPLFLSSPREMSRISPVSKIAEVSDDTSGHTHARCDNCDRQTYTAPTRRTTEPSTFSCNLDDHHRSDDDRAIFPEYFTSEMELGHIV